MSSNANNSNSANSGGIFGFFKAATNAATSAVKGATNAATNAMKNSNNKNSNNTKKNNSLNKKLNVLPANKGVNAPVIESQTQSGGAASVNYSVPYGQRQPSEAVMEWATTAGAPMPSSGMRNVAHGGKRRTKRHTKSHKRHTKSHKKHKTMKRKTRSKRHCKRRD